MQRSTPVRNSRSSTSDLLSWPEPPPLESPSAAASSGYRSRQPSDKIGEVLRGSQLTEEEAQSLTKRKPGSGYKMKATAGGSIFSASAEDATSEANGANSKNRTCIRVYQQEVSQISFSTEERISPKKPTSPHEVAKQRELSGALQSEPDTKSKRQISNAKTKELSGNDIFGPPPENVPRPLAPAPARTLESKESKQLGEPDSRNVHSSMKISNPVGGPSNVSYDEESAKKTSKRHYDQKSAEMMGNSIFKEEVPSVPAEKHQTSARHREMSGSDIFADGKAETRDYFRGSRRPPGGGSSIALV